MILVETPKTVAGHGDRLSLRSRSFPHFAAFCWHTRSGWLSELWFWGIQGMGAGTVPAAARKRAVEEWEKWMTAHHL